MDEKSCDIDTRYPFKLSPEFAANLNCFSQQMSEATKNLGLALQTVVEPYSKLINSIAQVPLSKFTSSCPLSAFTLKIVVPPL